MAVEILVARHGQNEDNANGILNGHRDLPLTDLGRQQAYDLAESIEAAGITFDTVYSSPLSRAYETAQIICSSLGLKNDPLIMRELIERDFGAGTGRPISEVVEEAGENVIKTEHITYVLDFENGETFPQLYKRACRALDKVRRMQEQGSALLVCHGDIGKMVYAAATGRAWKDVLRNFHFGNCDLIEVSQNSSAHKVKLPQHNL